MPKWLSVYISWTNLKRQVSILKKLFVVLVLFNQSDQDAIWSLGQIWLDIFQIEKEYFGKKPTRDIEDLNRRAVSFHFQPFHFQDLISVFPGI